MAKKSTYDPYVRQSVTVKADADRAFRVFLEELPQWWPPVFRVTKEGAPLSVEAKEGGRWYEIDDDGNEHAFGRVRVMDSPKRLVVGWHLNGYGQVDPDHASEFEVQFVPAGATTTVNLEHSKFDEMGEHAERVRNGMAQGWPILMAAYQQRVAGERQGT